LPDPAGRILFDWRLAARRFFAGQVRFKDVQPHDFLCWVVQDQAEEVKVDDRVQAGGQVMKQRGKIALLRDGLAHFEQGFELAPGVLQRGGMRHFRGRDDAFRHNRQDNTRASGGSTDGRAQDQP
jgi:hypothetical protein